MIRVATQNDPTKKRPKEIAEPSDSSLRKQDNKGAIMKCYACGEDVPPGNSVCPSCGERVANDSTAQGGSQKSNPPPTPRPISQNRGKSKVTAGLLALFLGGLGIHHFYLGASGTGVLYIFATFVTMGFWSLLALIDGVILLTLDTPKFDAKYNHRSPGAMEFVFSSPK